jgi:outer membrane protein OmpA-like peptidoglycan-associated protein
MWREICFTVMVVILSFRVNAQCFTLRGKVTNATNQQAVAASFFARSDNGKTLAGKSNSNGLFTLSIPCNISLLSIESSGFRSLMLPVSGNEGSYYFEVSLYPVDVQGNDKPYFQSEQTDTVLDNAGTGKSDKTLTRLFNLIDVQTKAQVAGEICLFYTKTGDKKCFSTSSGAKNGEVTFDQEDIVGVVATARGYQSYNGNLIINKIDNSRSAYEIGLSKAVTILAVSGIAEKSGKVEVLDKKQSVLPLQMKDPSQGFAVLSTGEDYRIRLYNNNDFEEKLLIKVDGLTLLKHRAAPRVTEGPIASPFQPVAVRQENITGFNPLPSRVIYFQQSSYDLQTDARQTLDSIGNWLSQHPETTALVIGFTDNVGDAKRNVILSEYRARVTTRYLVSHGAKESQLQWKGLGSSNPAGPNDDEQYITLNRRVEIRFADGMDTPSPK